MSRPFPIRKFASLRATWPWAAGIALFFTVLGALELVVPALHLEPGRPAPITMRRGPRVVPPPVARDPDQRTDLDAYRSEPVDPKQNADLLARQKDRLDRLPGWLAGNFALYLAAFVGMTFYLRRFGRGLVRSLRTHVVVFLSLAVWLALFKLYLLLTPWSPYFFPIAALSLVYGHHLGRRAGITVTLAVAAVGAAFLDFDLAYLAVAIFQGLVIGAMVEARKRMRPSRLVTVGLVLGVASAAAYGATMLAGGRVEIVESWLFVVQANPLVGGLFGGILSGLFAWWLSMPLGIALGVTSRSKLIDLQDVENQILRHVRERAPGTWEHSRAMANLAEAAAAYIGADGLLVRVGAYYHDYGKTVHPDFFIENILSEAGKEQPNPHKDLHPKDSADRIMEHVSLGVLALRQQNVPEAIVEFVYTHHGTSVIEFFWGKCQEADNQQGYTKEDFSYPGVRPQTREAGILMIVDAVEAASRTVQPPTREKFRNVVEHIVLSKLAQGQLDDSDLSLEDLHKVMDNLVDSLVHGRHERVRYPWQQKGEQPTAEQQAPPAVPPPPTPVPGPPQPTSGERPAVVAALASPPAPAPLAVPSPNAPAPATQAAIPAPLPPPPVPPAASPAPPAAAGPPPPSSAPGTPAAPANQADGI